MMRDSQRIEHMIGFAERISEIVAQADRTSFLSNVGLQEQLEINLLHFGEAAARMSEELRDKYDVIPWHKIIGMRNMLTHEYFRVSSGVMYDTAVNDIPGLLPILQTMKDENPYLGH